MSAIYKRSIREKIDESILQLASEFIGNGAFFFFNEADVKCRLYSIIKSNLEDPELVHSEWGEDYPRGRYDLVIWRPTKKNKALDCWGHDHKTIMKMVPDLLLASVEIDCLYGGDKKANQFTTYAKLMRNPDIIKLKKNIGYKFAYGYFLLLWDDEAIETYSNIVGKISTACRKLFKNDRISSIGISREKQNILFKHGFVV